jgi:hypothetical protein
MLAAGAGKELQPGLAPDRQRPTPDHTPLLATAMERAIARSQPFLSRSPNCSSGKAAILHYSKTPSLLRLPSLTAFSAVY